MAGRYVNVLIIESDNFVKIFEMKLYQIEILEPKAKKLLDELANLKLIRVQEVLEPVAEFKKVVSRLRNKGGNKPTLREISKEVEVVRRRRQGQ